MGNSTPNIEIIDINRFNKRAYKYQAMTCCIPFKAQLNRFNSTKQWVLPQGALHFYTGENIALKKPFTIYASSSYRHLYILSKDFDGLFEHFILTPSSDKGGFYINEIHQLIGFLSHNTI